MKLLTEPIAAAFEKLRHDNPKLRFVLLPVGIWVRRQDGNWQAVIQKGNGDDQFFILESGDIRVSMTVPDFERGLLPSAMATHGLF